MVKPRAHETAEHEVDKKIVQHRHREVRTGKVAPRDGVACGDAKHHKKAVPVDGKRTEGDQNLRGKIGVEETH